MGKKEVIYMAAPLFNIAERLHNLLLARELRRLGYKVILPQKEAMDFFNDNTGKFDLDGVSNKCAVRSEKTKIILADIDGADADSGTSLEVGIALLSGKKSFLFPRISDMTRTPLVICVRTDFRTDIEKEIGINGMFKLADKIIYKPALINSIKEAREFYRELAREIDKTIKELSVQAR